MKPLAAIVLLVAAAPAAAQAPAFCYAPDPDEPEWNITDFDPVRDADDFCKLAHNEPHKAKRQLSKAVALVRATRNLNRHYFTAQGMPDTFIQLLRPWMREANDRDEAAWRTVGKVVYDDRIIIQIWDVCEGGREVWDCPKNADYYEVELRPRWGVGLLNRGPYIGISNLYAGGDFESAMSFDSVEVTRYGLTDQGVSTKARCNSVAVDYWSGFRVDWTRALTEVYLDYVGTGAIPESDENGHDWRGIIERECS